jgi:predicted ATPase
VLEQQDKEITEALGLHPVPIPVAAVAVRVPQVLQM